MQDERKTLMPIADAFNSIEPNIRQDLKELSKNLTNTLIQTTKSLIRSFECITTIARYGQLSRQELYNWKKEAKETCKTFRKNYARQLNELKHCVPMTFQESSRLTMISQLLENTEVAIDPKYLKNDILDIAQICGIDTSYLKNTTPRGTPSRRNIHLTQERESSHPQIIPLSSRNSNAKICTPRTPRETNIAKGSTLRKTVGSGWRESNGPVSNRYSVDPNTRRVYTMCKGSSYKKTEVRTTTHGERTTPTRRRTLNGLNLIRKFEKIPEGQQKNNFLPPRIARSKSVTRVVRRGSLSKSPSRIVKVVNQREKLVENKENIPRPTLVNVVRNNEKRYSASPCTAQRTIKPQQRPIMPQQRTIKPQDVKKVEISKVLHQVRTSTNVNGTLLQARKKAIQVSFNKINEENENFIVLDRLEKDPQPEDDRYQDFIMEMPHKTHVLKESRLTYEDSSNGGSFVGNVSLKKDSSEKMFIPAPKNIHIMYHMEEGEQEESHQKPEEYAFKSKSDDSQNFSDREEAVTQITTAAHSLCTEEKQAPNTERTTEIFNMKKNSSSNISNVRTIGYEKRKSFEEKPQENAMTFDKKFNCQSTERDGGFPKLIFNNDTNEGYSSRKYYQEVETAGALDSKDIHSVKKIIGREISANDLVQGEWVNFNFF